ncbi:MAG: hypothetical protein Q9227_005730 [Pyrenula ochraceoflavens]
MSSQDPEKPPISPGTRHASFNSSSSTSLSSRPSCNNEPHVGLDPEKALTPQISHASQPQLSRKCTSVGTTGTQTDPSFEVDWEEDDKENPLNWPMWYKGVVIGFISFSTWTVVVYSTSYTTGLEPMMKEFHISSEPVATLGVTTYLIGLAVGSLILAPISETYGRKPVYVIAMVFFLLMLIPCGLATSMAEVIVVRFFGAVGGSAMIANAPGTVGDIVTAEYRALAFSIWSIGPLNGPVFGPVIGGFVTQYLGWRWDNWLVMIFAGVALALMAIQRETYTPALLQKRTARKRQSTGDERWWCRYDQKLPFIELMKVNLSRPFIMAIKEPICIFWNVYISIIYGILYLCFVAYPIVFHNLRGWSIGLSGLAFIGIGIGSMCVIVLEPLLRRLINSHKPDPDTGRPPPEAAMSVVCIAAVLVPIGELWFAWTCMPQSIHWAAPIAAGIPFGAGNTAVFIYASNYLVGAYGVYSASSLAGNSVIRSLLGGTLPLAGPAMYNAMGANWAGTLLGLLELAIVPIPFVFWRYGGKIRQKSALIRTMQEDQERRAKRAERSRARAREPVVVATNGKELEV